MDKTNLVIEHECTLNWLENYADMKEAGQPVKAWKVRAMRRHERDLIAKIEGAVVCARHVLRDAG